MTYRDYKSFWDIFLNKWRSNHDDLIQNDPAGQAFFPKDSRGNLIQTDLLENIACMPEPYYTGEAFKGAERWEDFKDAIVVLDLNPGLSHESDSLKSKNSPSHPILEDLAKGGYSKGINNDKYSPFISTNKSIPGVTWWKSKRLTWFSRFLSVGNVREKMFAFELCPFHSKSWNITLNPKSIDFINRNVLTPVASILTGNGKSRLGYCFGKDWEKIFSQIGFEEVAKWGIDYDNLSKPFVSPSGSAISSESWPKKTGTSTNINRIYKLYRGYINDTEIYFLCLRGSGTFTAPGPVFANTEEGIKEDMKRLYNINV
jgi:hypothetical protein